MTAALADIAQMVSGKFLELGQQPQNVQVLEGLESTDANVTLLMLQDDGGMFLNVPQQATKR